MKQTAHYGGDGHIMKIITRRNLLCCALVIASAAAAAETVTYTGSAMTAVNKASLPLGNGDAVITAANRGVAAISTTPPTLLEMSCVGMGVLNGTGGHSTEFYCTMKANDTDILDLKGNDSAEGGKVTVIGGSGKWTGATGSGTFQRISGTETEAVSSFEISVTTP